VPVLKRSISIVVSVSCTNESETENRRIEHRAFNAAIWQFESQMAGGIDAYGGENV
jgi:hypothetical protein